MVVTQFNFFTDRNYFAAWLTHFFVDVMNNARNLLIAILAISLGLTNTHVGIVLLLYNIGNALCQPFFGLLADRIGTRWLIVGGVGWMIFFYSLSAVTGDWVALIATTIASVGSGAFHPSGTKVASQIPEPYRNRATAVFFLAGQLGLFVGPVLAGFFLNAYGRVGFLALPMMALVALVSGWHWLTNKPNTPIHQYTSQKPAQVATRNGRRAALIIIIILTAYSISSTLTIFLPKLFTELNYSQSAVGILSGSYLFGGAFGGIVGGYLGDRFQKKWVIGISLLLASLPLFFILSFTGAAQVAWLVTAGFFAGMPHSLLVLMAQSLFPTKQGMASGLVLGFMFFSGSVGSTILGYTADTIGLATMLGNLWLLSLTAAIVAFLLPTENQ